MILRLLAQPLQAADAFGDLYQRHSQRVYALCLRMTRDAPVAEDLTQEVFIHLGRSDRFVEKVTLLPGYNRLTVNQVLMYLRHTKRRKEHVVDPLEMVQMHSTE